MRFDGPVLFDVWVTEIAHFLQHGLHEGGTKLLNVGDHPLPAVDIVRECILPSSCVIVEGRKCVQELTASLHVPGFRVRVESAEWFIKKHRETEKSYPLTH